MQFEKLKQKASSLPMVPGVYLMRDCSGNVIYVGKAKKLRNRVNQYFQDTAAHSPKTKLMVSKIADFDVIIASSEFEALVLECAQIKHYMPKYNILLKDDKGYPYVRLSTNEPFPRLTMVSKTDNDGAEYYGPYGSRGVTQSMINAILRALKLPTCSKKFPRDIGTGRPCLNYHMKQCIGWCQQENCSVDYLERMKTVKKLLAGNFKEVLDAIRSQMLEASDALNFELAASLRDQMTAIQTLSQKQHVHTAASADVDAVGYGSTSTKACFAILHFSNGELIDKEYEIIPPDDASGTVSALVKQYYLNRGSAPRCVLLPFETEDSALFSDLLYREYGRRTSLKVPQRGNNLRMTELACKNALEEAQRVTNKEERALAPVIVLSKMLRIPFPERIESFDISNTSGTDNVASMVVFQNGKSAKGCYKRFRVDLSGEQDDYESMRQVLRRRLSNYKVGKKGFEIKPDLMLIDGGSSHAALAQNILSELELQIPVFGMVKDDRHRTRALITADGKEIRIDNNQSVFSLIGRIQEETHRFAISYHRKLRNKRLKLSELDRIPGIGPKRKQSLIRYFQSLSAIRDASIDELERILPVKTAADVYKHFHNTEG